MIISGPTGLSTSLQVGYYTSNSKYNPFHDLPCLRHPQVILYFYAPYSFILVLLEQGNATSGVKVTFLFSGTKSRNWDLPHPIIQIKTIDRGKLQLAPMASWRQVNLPTVKNRRRPMSMPLPLRGYPSFSNTVDIDFFVSPDHQIHKSQRAKFQVDIALRTGLAYSFCAISGIVFLYILCHSHFNITRVAFSVSLSIGFLPFVWPMRWLVMVMFRLVLWCCFFLLALSTQIARPVHHITANITHGIRQKSKHKTGKSSRVLAIQFAIGTLVLYLLVSEVPLIRVAILGIEVLRTTVDLLRAIVLMQYYIILLSSLKFLIYLRVDRILNVMGTAWFRWAIRQIWSVTTWADIIVSKFL